LIIRFPTGFYRDVIPHNVGVSGNTTFIISNTDPLRSDLVIPKISAGIILRKRGELSQSIVNKRKLVGGLVFTVSSSKRVELGNNSRQYEIGDVLDFDKGMSPIVDPMLVNQITEIRHDVNLMDSASIGLTDDDVAVIASTSLLAQASLTEALNNLKQERSDAEQVVITQQKIINEISKTLSALNSIKSQVSNTEVDQLISKLTIREAQAIVVRDEAIDKANLLAAKANDVLSQLRSVSIVVK
jgi:hypothetical protein